QPEFSRVRKALPDQAQWLGFANVGAIVHTAQDLGAASSDQSDLADIFGGAGFASDTSPDRSDAALVVRVKIPDSLPRLASNANAQRSTMPVTVLIDGSRAGPLASQLEEGSPFRTFLKDQLGAQQVDVVGPDERIGHQ